MAKLHPNVLK